MVDIVEQQESSGLSVAEYCDANGITYGKLYIWRKQYYSDIHLVTSQSESPNFGSGLPNSAQLPGPQ